PIIAYGIFKTLQMLDGNPVRIHDRASPSLEDEGRMPLRRKLKLVSSKWLSFRVLFTFTLLLWVWQSFTWGGVYLGYGLAVVGAIVALGRFMAQDFITYHVISR
ncbi:unnamed protein product, partial [Choristocarpus tenellus]